MKDNLEKSLMTYKRKNIIRKRIITILALLAVCTFFLVDNMMMITAVGKDKNPKLSADQVMMLTGGELKATVIAEADADKDETVFVIKCEGTGAGLAETYQFINGAADITDYDGVVRKLFIDETEEDGTVLYGFTLAKGESTEFDLYFAESGQDEAEEGKEAEAAEIEKTAEADNKSQNKPEDKTKPDMEIDATSNEDNTDSTSDDEQVDMSSDGTENLTDPQASEEQRESENSGNAADDDANETTENGTTANAAADSIKTSVTNGRQFLSERTSFVYSAESVQTDGVLKSEFPDVEGHTFETAEAAGAESAGTSGASGTSETVGISDANGTPGSGGSSGTAEGSKSDEASSAALENAVSSDGLTDVSDKTSGDIQKAEGTAEDHDTASGAQDENQNADTDQGTDDLPINEEEIATVIPETVDSDGDGEERGNSGEAGNRDIQNENAQNDDSQNDEPQIGKKAQREMIQSEEAAEKNDASGAENPEKKDKNKTDPEKVKDKDKETGSTETESKETAEPRIVAEAVLTAGSGKDAEKALAKAEKDEEPLILQWADEGLPDQEQFLTAAIFTDGNYHTRLREPGTEITVVGKMPVGTFARAVPVTAESIYGHSELEYAKKTGKGNAGRPESSDKAVEAEDEILKTAGKTEAAEGENKKTYDKTEAAETDIKEAADKTETDAHEDSAEKGTANPAQDIWESAPDETAELICIYDISLYTPDGREWQPAKGSLEVSIRTEAMQEVSLGDDVKDVKVYHIDENGNPETVRILDGLEGLQEDRGVAFEARSFSPYAVVVLKDSAPEEMKADTVYLSGQGDDANTGLSPDKPVKTFAKAKEILGDKEGIIYICRTVQVTENETWELGTGQSVERLPSSTERNYTGTMVHVKDGAALTLGNITLDGGSEDESRGTDETKAKGPIILVDEGSSADLGTGTILQNNDNTNTTADELLYSCYGGGVAVYGGSLIINGAEITNCKAAFGGGVFIGRSGSATMNSGSITGNEAAIIDGAPIMEALPTITHDSGAGGGVALAVKTSIEEEMLAQGETAAFVMNGGTISGNTAYTGGGISAGSYNFYETSFYADHNLTVNGGRIEENTADNAGGGIFIGAGATGLFTGHSRTDICGNAVVNGDQNAGGGIYIDGECDILGKVQMDNVIISDNTSSSYGGGISACPSGDTNILLERGGAIFGNTAAGNALSDDIFIDRSSSSYLVDTMLGGGSHNWEFTYSQDLLGKANPTDTDIANAEHNAHIFITGNKAESPDPQKGRGGGIGNNGLLEIGEKEPHSFAIRKIDEGSEANLAGAKFLLEGTTVSGTSVKVEQITESDGYAIFENLPFGVYTLRETEAPEDYILSDRVLTLDIHAGTGVTLTENGETLPLENSEYGWDYVFPNNKEDEPGPDLTIELYKMNEAQSPLSGAVFELYKFDDADTDGTEQNGEGGASGQGGVNGQDGESGMTMIGEQTTDSDGQAFWKKLEPGRYLLRETQAPLNYLPIENDIELTLNEDGSIELADGDTQAVLDNARKNRVNVTDKSDYTLPATGGSGTTIFIMAGLMLMAAALALIYRFKKTH